MSFTFPHFAGTRHATSKDWDYLSDNLCNLLFRFRTMHCEVGADIITVKPNHFYTARGGITGDPIYYFMNTLREA